MNSHLNDRRRKPLNVAIVGCGYISEAHLEAWRNIDANIVAVCDKNVSIAKSKANKWRIPRFYEDVSKMVEAEDLDVVSVCTPANVRLSVVRPIVEAAVHVVIEKPFAMSVKEAKEMVDLKDKYGIKLTVVHNWLFSHMMKRTLNYLRNGWVGDIASVEISMYHTKKDPMAADSSHWCHRIQAGRFGENLPHPLYIIRTILGDLKVRCIHGSKLGNYPWMPIDELWVLLEDMRGRTATIYVSFNASIPETILNIVGERGILYTNLASILVKKRYREVNGTIQFAMDNLKTLSDIMMSSFSIASAILTRRYKGMHTEFMKGFAKSIINDTEPPVAAEEALKVVESHTDLCTKIHELYFGKKEFRAN